MSHILVDSKFWTVTYKHSSKFNSQVQMLKQKQHWIFNCTVSLMALNSYHHLRSQESRSSKKKYKELHYPSTTGQKNDQHSSKLVPANMALTSESAFPTSFWKELVSRWRQFQNQLQPQIWKRYISFSPESHMLEGIHNLEKIGNLPQRRQRSVRGRKFAFFMDKIRTLFDKILCDVRTSVQGRLDITKQR